VIYALPGFLGLQSDWSALKKELPSLIPIDPYQIALPEQGLHKWAQAFNKILPKEPILLGYSMGARLCMHTLLENFPKALILISGNPGLKTQEERKKRLKLDRIWAKRFQKEPWESLMHSWNNRSVFSAAPLIRYEKDYCRNTLSSALKSWSLAHQMDFSTILEQAPIPILWITGKLDKAYSKKSMKFSHPLSQSWSVPSSGHRVPWEQPKAFLKILHQFLRLIEQST
jgi:2-succinyl-6-hydroxy-2,4-cyclohexadiene-1-carboxylate synthase